jgi:hypothetical protein
MFASLALEHILFTFGIQKFFRRKYVPGKSEYPSYKKKGPITWTPNHNSDFVEGGSKGFD